MLAWYRWHKSVIDYFNIFCVISYEDLKEDVIKTIKPCVEFLGFQINQELEKCILKHKNGYHIRKTKGLSLEERTKLLSQIPEEDMQKYVKRKETIFKKLRKKTYKSLNKSDEL